MKALLRLRIVRWTLFALLYLRDLGRANARLARDVLSPSPKISPSFHRLEICPMGNGPLLVLANLISMTPGTLTVDVSRDRRYLLVHLLYRDSRAELEDNFLPLFYDYVLGRQTDV